MNNNKPPEMTSPHITEVRSLMMEQLRALRSAKPGSELEAEIARSKGMSEITQTLINSAKVEIDYLALTEQPKSGFLEEPADPSVSHLGQTATGTLTQEGNRTVHRLRG